MGKKTLIYLEDAIDAIQHKLGVKNESYLLPSEKAVVEMLKNLPSAQPYTDEEIQKMQDMEQAQLEKAFELGKAEAQPEIIRCRYCEHWDKSWTNDWMPNHHYCPMVDGVRGENWYCADAERRTDETD